MQFDSVKDAIKFYRIVQEQLAHTGTCSIPLSAYRVRERIESGEPFSRMERGADVALTFEAVRVVFNSFPPEVQALLISDPPKDKAKRRAFYDRRSRTIARLVPMFEGAGLLLGLNQEVDDGT